MNIRKIIFGVVLLSFLLAGFFLTTAQQTPSRASQSWLSQDVGRTAVKGSFAASGGVYTVQGSGADIWGSADALHFAYQPWTGDGEIVARVVSVAKTDPWAKAGVMIRASLTENSPHAMVAVTPEKGPTFIRRLQPSGRSYDDAHQAMRVVRKDGKVLFQQRGSAGVDKATDAITALPSPRWIKLVRQGSVFKAYDSTDGITWEWLGTDQIEMAGQVYVGLAVSSHDPSKLCAAAFDQVSLNQAPSNAESAAKTGTGDGLQATYYSQMNFSGQAINRIDPTVNFDWGLAAPAEGIGKNAFSVRWEGELVAQFTEPYAIHVMSDDRARLWLNGELIIDEWYEHGEQISTAVVSLEAGKRYSLRLDYFENRGRAVAKLLWSSPSTPRQVIPQGQLYSRVVAHNQDSFDPLSRPQKNSRLPASWLNQDIGRVGQEGSAESANGIWSVKGSGADIWANGDGFHFVYQPWRGDGQIVARVLSQQSTDPWAKTGVMLRETLTADSRHLALAVTPDHGIVFLHRHQAATITEQDLGGAAGSQWLKLARRGNIFSSFASTDGVNWQWIGTETMDLSNEIYVGLAVNSHDNSALGAATFDQVSIEKARPEQRVRVVRGSGDGLGAAYFDGTTGKTASRIDATVNFDWDTDSPADGIGNDNFSVRWDGVLEAQSDELYALHVVSDDGARLWFNGKLVIDAWSDRGASLETAKISLKAGYKYPIKLEFYERSGEAIAKLLWSTPTIAKQPVPQSQLYSVVSLTDVPAAQLSSTKALADGSGRKGETATTPSVAADVSPRSEIGAARRLAPAATGITGFATVAEKPGAAAVARVGRWQIEGASLYAADRRGSLEYELNAPADDMYQLEVEGASHNPFDTDAGFYLALSIDGEYLERTLLNAAQGQSGRVQVFTPWLKAGSHRVHISWDNARKGRSLKLAAVRLQSLQAPDADGNGIKDWVENKLKNENGVDSGDARSGSAAISSSISPACVEGRGGFVSMMKIRGNGQDATAEHGAGSRWYANVPLSPDQATPVEVSFQNGGRQEHRQITWEPTDLLKSSAMTIRQGDALLFTVGQPSGPSQTATTTRLQIAGVTQYVLSPSKPMPHRFDKAGTFIVTGTVTDPDGKTETGRITVTVVQAVFGGSPVAWTAHERVWDCPGIPAQVTVDHDPRISLAEVAGAPEGGKRYRLKLDAPEDRHVVARLGERGPILTSATIHGINIYGVSESGAFYGKQYEDGSRLVETAVAYSRVFKDVRVALDIIVAGIMFDDGTLQRILRAEDFDDTGLANVTFIMPPGVQTSNCHIMKAYQNQTHLGDY